MSPNSKRLKLVETTGAQDWLRQFHAQDVSAAQKLLETLTLVSHSAFERALTRQIERAASGFEGPVALYAVREPEPGTYLDSSGKPPDAVRRGSDLGSEARVAAVIRNMARANPKQYLNHPGLDELRYFRCRALVLVDDFIGSGKRASSFLDSLWFSPSLRSWHSFGWIKLVVAAYSGTESGVAFVRKAVGHPDVQLYRDCPTLWDLPWTQPLKDSVADLCKRYGARTSRPNMRLGFRDSMSLLVFEHGCPNNVPAILWSSKGSKWRALFPSTRVPLEQASAFPPDVSKPEATVVVRDAGDHRLAESEALKRGGPIGSAILTVLAVISRGARGRAALSYATGLPISECGELLDRCVEAGFLTPTLKVTPAGRSELADAKEWAAGREKVPPRGNDVYYPHQLRGPGFS